MYIKNHDWGSPLPRISIYLDLSGTKNVQGSFGAIRIITCALVLQFYCISICIFTKTAVSNYDILHHLWCHMFYYLNQDSNRGYKVCGVFLRFDSSRKISYIWVFHSSEGVSNFAFLHRAPKINSSSISMKQNRAPQNFEVWFLPVYFCVDTIIV